MSKSTNSTHNAKDVPGDLSLSLEFLLVVGVVLIGGVVMVLVVYNIERYRDEMRGRKILGDKEVHA